MPIFRILSINILEDSNDSNINYSIYNKDMEPKSNKIEESPFMDMRDRKNYYESTIKISNTGYKYELPTFVEDIEW